MRGNNRIGFRLRQAMVMVLALFGVGRKEAHPAKLPREWRSMDHKVAISAAMTKRQKREMDAYRRRRRRLNRIARHSRAENRRM